jgi:hypothetical protein
VQGSILGSETPKPASAGLTFEERRGGKGGVMERRGKMGKFMLFLYTATKHLINNTLFTWEIVCFT